MKYYSSSDVVAFAASLGSITTESALETWAAASANDPVLDDNIVGDQALKVKIAEMIASKFPGGDGETITGNAQIIYDWATGTTGGGDSSSGGNEFIHRITANAYTVLRANGLLQNLVYDLPGTPGTLTLPSGADAIGMVLYVSNTTNALLSTSATIWVNASTSIPGVSAGSAIKIVYNNTEGKWYYTA